VSIYGFSENSLLTAAFFVDFIDWIYLKYLDANAVAGFGDTGLITALCNCADDVPSLLLGLDLALHQSLRQWSDFLKSFT